MWNSYSPIISLTLGRWTIGAELDANQPARLTVRHEMKKSVFSYGNENPILDGTPHARTYRGSSLLYDKVNGEYTVAEQKDYLPVSTRTGK